MSRRHTGMLCYRIDTADGIVSRETKSLCIHVRRWQTVTINDTEAIQRTFQCLNIQYITIFYLNRKYFDGHVENINNNGNKKADTMYPISTCCTRITARAATTTTTAKWWICSMFSSWSLFSLFIMLFRLLFLDAYFLSAVCWAAWAMLCSVSVRFVRVPLFQAHTT